VRDALDPRRDSRSGLGAGRPSLNGRGRGGLGAINGPALRSVLSELMTDDAARDAMSAAARRIGRGNSAADIAKQVLYLGEKPGVDRAPDSVEATC
jgi:hypothetical protein